MPDALDGTHDPGGKVRLRLPDGMIGGAVFSECKRHRFLLWRRWGRAFEVGYGAAYALWIGMNPSTADADVDDPTCRKERIMTHAWGLLHYRKVNVMSYRSTKPSGLLADGVDLCPPLNFDVVLEEANGAACVVAAWGAMNWYLRPHADDLAAALRKNGIELWCLGTTANGSPRHPLYVRGDTKLVRWEG